MWFRSLFNALKPRKTPHRATTRRLHLEVLEDRCLPSFSMPVDYGVGLAPQAMAAGDFNGDGTLDLAAANSAYDSVSVLLGNADGTFQPARTSATGVGPQSVAVGDFNSDGNLDLATANYSDVSVLLGDGLGGFGAPASISDGTSPVSVAVADFNGDGTLDLGVTSYTAYWDEYGNEIRTSYANVLLGNGDGAFTAPNTTTLGSGPYGPAVVADFNADGTQDLASASFYYGKVTVLLGDGLGHLNSPTHFAACDFPWSVAAGDVNGDSRIDLVTANYIGTDLSVMLGDGAGGFGSPVHHAAGINPSSIVLGDFTGDGNLDIATANYQGNDVSILRGGGDGTFSTPVYSTAGSWPRAIVAADFNGDGWLDAATANEWGSTVSVLINDHSWPPEDAPSVYISDVTVTEGNTGSVNAIFTVSLSAAYSQPVTVHYETANGSATAGNDYIASSGDVTFGIGETSKTITIAVLGDMTAEPTENFVVNLNAPTNATIADGQGMGTILDDEAWISIGDVTVTEGNSGAVKATFSVSLSSAYDAPVTVEYQTANDSAVAGSDYQAQSGMLTFAPNETSKSIAVLVNGDRIGEANETFLIILSNPTNAAIAYGTGEGTIVDDEPRISISDVTKKEGNGRTTVFTFTVTLSVAYDVPFTINFATTDGTAKTSDNDYVANSGSMTCAPGETTKSITVVVKGDKKKEANENFFVDLSDLLGYAVFLDSRGTGTILNDD
jgi:ribosomal protein L35AE/L33A